MPAKPLMLPRRLLAAAPTGARAFGRRTGAKAHLPPAPKRRQQPAAPRRRDPPHAVARVVATSAPAPPAPPPSPLDETLAAGALLRPSSAQRRAPRWALPRAGGVATSAALALAAHELGGLLYALVCRYRTVGGTVGPPCVTPFSAPWDSCTRTRPLKVRIRYQNFTVQKQACAGNKHLNKPIL